MSEPQTHTITVSESHISNSSVSKPHICNVITVSKPWTLSRLKHLRMILFLNEEEEKGPAMCNELKRDQFFLSSSAPS